MHKKKDSNIEYNEIINGINLIELLLNSASKVFKLKIELFQKSVLNQPSYLLLNILKKYYK